MYITSKYDEAADLFKSLSYRPSVAVMEIMLKYEAEPLTVGDIARIADMDENMVRRAISNFRYAEIVESSDHVETKQKFWRLKSNRLSECLKALLRLYEINNF